jgi:hypothetical protein
MKFDEKTQLKEKAMKVKHSKLQWTVLRGVLLLKYHTS